MPTWGLHPDGSALRSSAISTHAKATYQKKKIILKVMLCCFIEVAFINISKVFIRKTTGTERRLWRLREEMPREVSAASATTTNETSTPSEGLALWGLQRGQAHFVGCPLPPWGGSYSEAMYLSSD